MPVMVCQSVPNVCLCIAQPALLHVLQATIQNDAITEASCKGPLDNIRAVLQKLQSAPKAAPDGSA